jgi:hypothetical protein
MIYTDKGAQISTDERYRYLLWREWRGSATDANWHWLEDENGRRAKDGAGADLGEPKSVLFIMLNPSTADGSEDDPTIRRCVAYAKAWRFDRVEVVHLFAYRTSSPKVLLALNHDDDPIGIDNKIWVERAASRAGLIVCAWGDHGNYLGQDETVLGWLGSREWHSLGFTKDGRPKHPLYLPAAAQLVLMHGRSRLPQQTAALSRALGDGET